ncbi:MBL fold metallo-hydrolase [Candidatus Bipolaricaulota bacterium]|nr:MBL fold metallo-hydrolase [Candidatus Bipolaricaulota bacterium]
MEKLRVAEGILQYRFPPHEGKHYGFNILALLDEEKKAAWLVDTAYEEQAGAVRRELEKAGYTITGAVISHFHPDHVLGLAALPKMIVIGSPRAEETLSPFGEPEEWEARRPTRSVGESDVVRFGPFELRFRFAPGHSPCSMYALIDDRFVHVADNVMTSNDGRDILPWAEFERIQDHIDSLDLLREFGDRTALLSHGVTIDDAAILNEAIDNRIKYFRAVLDGDGAISIDEATADCKCDFLHKEWLIRKGAA